MAINFNQTTNNITADSGSVSINGVVPSSGGATKTIVNTAVAYNVTATDLGKIINCTSGTFNVSLTAAATLGSGFTCTIWNTGTGAITIDPNAAETIDGVATLILQQGEGLAVVCNGTNWETDDKKPMRGYAEKISGANARPIASAAAAIAISSSSATGVASNAFGYTASAASDYSSAFGTSSAGSGSVTATGAGAMALGGSYASGTDSFAAAIGNNTSSYGAQNQGSIAMGYIAKVSGSYRGTAIGGYGAIVSGSGGININSDDGSGWGSTVSGSMAVAIGTGNKSAQFGKYTYAAGFFAAQGDRQSGKIVISASTTTTTAVVLTSDGGAASTTNQLIVSSGQAMAIQGTLIAKQSGSGNMAGWNITGIVSNNAGTMVVSGLALTAIGSDSITLGAQPTIAVDNTNKGVTITSGYKSATSIRWVATLNTSEVTYA